MPGKLRDGRQQEWDWKWERDKRAAGMVGQQGGAASRTGKGSRRAFVLVEAAVSATFCVIYFGFNSQQKLLRTLRLAPAAH